MYSPHDPGAPEPLDRLLRWPRADGRWWKRWLVGIVTSVLAIALIAACGWCLALLTLYRPHVAGTYPIQDSHDPMVFSISMVSADDGWAVGAENRYRTQGMLAHYQNGQWMPVTPPANTPALNSVFMLSASEGWPLAARALLFTIRMGAGRALVARSVRTSTASLCFHQMRAGPEAILFCCIINMVSGRWCSLISMSG